MSRYGKGGSEPTVTDANLALGYLADGALLGGSIRLSRQAALQAIASRIAEPLGISIERAALGIITLVNLNMVSGIRRVSVERGYDPRQFALIGAGGAAGMHVIRLAEEIGSQVVLIPKVASGLCAFGQILSDIRYDQLTTLPMRLDDQHVDLALLNRTLARLREQGLENLRQDGFSNGNRSIPSTTWKSATWGRSTNAASSWPATSWTRPASAPCARPSTAGTRRCSPTASRRARSSW